MPSAAGELLSRPGTAPDATSVSCTVTATLTDLLDTGPLANLAAASTENPPCAPVYADDRDEPMQLLPADSTASRSTDEEMVPVPTCIARVPEPATTTTSTDSNLERPDDLLWTLYFDGACRHRSTAIGAAPVLVPRCLPAQ